MPNAVTIYEKHDVDKNWRLSLKEKKNHRKTASTIKSAPIILLPIAVQGLLYNSEIKNTSFQ